MIMCSNGIGNDRWEEESEGGREEALMRFGGQNHLGWRGFFGA